MAKTKRNIYKVNTLERKILKTIFLYASFPMIVVILVFFALFSDLIYFYIRSDLGSHFMDRFWVLAAFLCLYYVIFTRMVFRFANRLAGAYPRVIREVDEILKGTRPRGHIKLRKGDYSHELIEQINRLIDKFR